MRSSPRTVAALALLGVAVLAAAAPRDARAQTMGTFSWMPPAKVQEAMEKQQRPGILFFDAGDLFAIAGSINFQFTQPQVITVLKKHNFAACKITAVGQGSRIWGSYQKLADEFGVGSGSALVFLAWDRHPMAVLAQVVKRDEFLVFLGKIAAQHRERLKLTEDSSDDLVQAEKWIEEKKFSDAIRRVEMIVKREGKISPKVIDKAHEVEAKLQTIGNDRLAEGKRLLEAGKADEARPILEEVANAFQKYDCGKEAKDLLKKAGKAGAGGRQ
jgi:hypothetical protein